jgi:hypothetical protein
MKGTTKDTRDTKGKSRMVRCGRRPIFQTAEIAELRRDVSARSVGSAFLCDLRGSNPFAAEGALVVERRSF